MRVRAASTIDRSRSAIGAPGGSPASTSFAISLAETRSS
jgi:hypothetical protein